MTPMTITMPDWPSWEGSGGDKESNGSLFSRLSARLRFFMSSIDNLNIPVPIEYRNKRAVSSLLLPSFMTASGNIPNTAHGG
jgi:hypothetical protein